MTTPTRARIPRDVADRVLIRSRRRCCLCAHWDDDITQKDGQLAHIDRNPAHSVEDNLAYLCFRHHNLYDAQQIQGKNPTPGELRYARDSLYTSMQDRSDSTIAVTLEIDGEFRDFSDAKQAELLELIRTVLGRAYDIRVIDKRPGSIRLTIEVEPEEALLLGDLQNAGALKAHGITSLTMYEVLQRDIHEFRAEHDSVLMRIVRRTQYADTFGTITTRLIRDLDFVNEEIAIATVQDGEIGFLSQSNDYTVERFSRLLGRCVRVFFDTYTTIRHRTVGWKSFVTTANDIELTIKEFAATCSSRLEEMDGPLESTELEELRKVIESWRNQLCMQLPLLSFLVRECEADIKAFDEEEATSPKAI